MTSAGVRVVSVDLDQPAAVVEALDDVLPAGERDVPARTRVARAATRIVLARALGVGPADVTISRTCAHCGDPTHGRPTVTADPPLAFNLSHSGGFAVVALAVGPVRLGVDVEEVEPRLRLEGLAARVLSPQEHLVWRAIDDPREQLRSFLRSWTAKEAYLKALGIGITTRLRDVPVAPAGWCTRELDLGPARVGALAIDRDEVEIEYSVFSRLDSTPGSGTSARPGDQDE